MRPSSTTPRPPGVSGTVVMMRISAQAAKASAKLTSRARDADRAQRDEEHEEDRQVAGERGQR